jgi:hypothetical protein
LWLKVDQGGRVVRVVNRVSIQRQFFLSIYTSKVSINFIRFQKITAVGRIFAYLTFSLQIYLLFYMYDALQPQIMVNWPEILNVLTAKTGKVFRI